MATLRSQHDPKAASSLTRQAPRLANARLLLSIHALLHHGALNRLVPVMQHERIIRAHTHLLAGARNHLLLVLRDGFILGDVAAQHALHGSEQLRGVGDAVVEALAALVGHGVCGIAGERDAAAARVPAVVRRRRVPVGHGHVPDRQVIGVDPGVGGAPGVGVGSVGGQRARLRQPRRVAPVRARVLLRQRRPPADVEEEGPGLGPRGVAAVLHAEEREVAARVDRRQVQRVVLAQRDRLLRRVPRVDERRADGQAPRFGGLRPGFDDELAHDRASAVGADEDASC